MVEQLTINGPAVALSPPENRVVTRPSNREIQAMQYASDDVPERLIAPIMGISRSSVKKYIKECIRKTGTHTKIAAVKVMVKNGWIT